MHYRAELILLSSCAMPSEGEPGKGIAATPLCFGLGASLLPSPLVEGCTHAMCRRVRSNPGGWRLAAAGQHLPPQLRRTGFIGAATEAGRSCPAYLFLWQKNS
jgi:hypothetical protein